MSPTLSIQVYLDVIPSEVVASPVIVAGPVVEATDDVILPVVVGAIVDGVVDVEIVVDVFVVQIN